MCVNHTRHEKLTTTEKEKERELTSIMRIKEDIKRYLGNSVSTCQSSKS